MTAGELTGEVLDKLREQFYACEKNKLAQNVCSGSDPLEACLKRRLKFVTTFLPNILFPAA